jgi:methyl-accepting chemotaxis protein
MPTASHNLFRKVAPKLALPLVALSLGLGFLLDYRKSHVVAADDALTAAVADIRYDILQLSDAMRAAILAPDSGADKERLTKADEHLNATIRRLRTEYATEASLAAALDAMTEFDAKSLAPEEHKVMELLAKDPKAAAAHYNSGYDAKRREFDRLFATFAAEAQSVIAAHQARLRVEAWICYGAMGVLLVLCFAAGAVVKREQAQAEEAFKRRLTDALDRVLHDVAANAQNLGSAAEKLSATSQQMVGNAEQTSAQAGTVSSSASQVSKSVDTVSTGAEEMGAAIKEIARSASEAAQVAAEAVRVAGTANATVAKLGKSSRPSRSRRTCSRSTRPSRPRAPARPARASRSSPTRSRTSPRRPPRPPRTSAAASRPSRPTPRAPCRPSPRSAP